MIDFKAITDNNGWEYAILGASIVFSGLVILSIVISQLHKLLLFWDKRASFLQALKDRLKGDVTAPEMPADNLSQPASLTESMRQYKLIVDRIGEPFALPKLLHLAKKRGLNRPHATINELLQAGVIHPDDTGYYIWKS